MDELDQLIAEYVADLQALVSAGLVHNPALHVTEEAKQDKGRMSFCPGCEANILGKRLYEALSARDDTVPQTRFKGKSRKEAVLERLKERKQIEAAP